MIQPGTGFGFVSGGYLYFGMTEGSHGLYASAPIAADGTLGAWDGAGFSIPESHPFLIGSRVAFAVRTNDGVALRSVELKDGKAVPPLKEVLLEKTVPHVSVTIYHRDAFYLFSAHCGVRPLPDEPYRWLVDANGDATPSFVAGGYSPPSSTIFAWKSFMYAIGGGPSCSTDSNQVRFAPIDASGAVQAEPLGNVWADTTPLPPRVTAATRGSVVVLDDHVLLQNQGEIYTGELHDDGVVSRWTKISTLPQAVEGGALVATATHLYVIGGVGISTVYYAAFE